MVNKKGISKDLKNGDWRNVVKAASVYTGIVIGAGFASGQELMQFFARYGHSGIIGIILSGFIISVSGWAVMDICVSNKITCYDGFMSAVLGKTLGKVINFAVNIFICVLFFTMLAGAGAMGRESLSLPYSAGVIIISVLCFVALLFDIGAIVKVNLILAPLLFASGLFFGLYSIISGYEPAVAVLNSNTPTAGTTAWAGLVYASYNIITAVSVLTGMGGVVDSRRTAKLAGLIGGGCLTVLGVVFTLPLITYFDVLHGLEIPMLGIAQRYGGIIEKIYVFILFAAIYTTAVSNAFAASEWLHGLTGAGKTKIKLLLCVFGVAAAHMGFSTFVGKAYPFFGYIGIFEIAAILIYFLAQNNIRRKEHKEREYKGREYKEAVKYGR